MSDSTLGDQAIVTFLQALGVAIINFDDLPLEDRHSRSLIVMFDGYLGEIVKMAEVEGYDVRGNVKYLREGLERALQQAKSS